MNDLRFKIILLNTMRMKIYIFQINIKYKATLIITLSINHMKSNLCINNLNENNLLA